MRGSRGESESWEDLEGSQNHVRIETGGQKEEGPGNLQENQSSSVYIVKLLNMCIGPLPPTLENFSGSVHGSHFIL